MENVWYVYLINDSDYDLESVMVVSKAFGTIDGEMKKTSLLRHAFMQVPSVAAVKIEMVEKSVLQLNNEFMVTYFIGNTLYDKKFTFRKNMINEYATEEIPVLFVNGVIVRWLLFILSKKIWPGIIFTPFAFPTKVPQNKNWQNQKHQKFQPKYECGKFMNKWLLTVFKKGIEQHNEKGKEKAILHLIFPPFIHY